MLIYWVLGAVVFGVSLTLATRARMIGGAIFLGVLYALVASVANIGKFFPDGKLGVVFVGSIGLVSFSAFCLMFALVGQFAGEWLHHKLQNDQRRKKVGNCFKVAGICGGIMLLFWLMEPSAMKEIGDLGVASRVLGAVAVGFIASLLAQSERVQGFFLRRIL